MDEILTKNDFISDEFDHYGLGQYRQYLKLTEAQKERIRSLKQHEGKYVEFMFRGKPRLMLLVAVILRADEVVDSFAAYPYQFRLHRTGKSHKTYNLTGGGFWTNKIDNLITVIE